VYLTKSLAWTHGPCIQYGRRFSLPFRGVNMSFKANYVYDAWFPEHKLLRGVSGNEQYFSLSILDYWDLIKATAKRPTQVNVLRALCIPR